MRVKLAHCSNPDIRGGYWCVKPNVRAEWVEVESIEYASRVCRAYIDTYQLGGGNWAGGTVMDGKRKLGRISYNGSFHPAE